LAGVPAVAAGRATMAWWAAARKSGPPLPFHLRRDRSRKHAELRCRGVTA